jgi:hypothetical protein
MSKSIDTASLKKQLQGVTDLIHRYKSLLFFLVITSLYGYIIWRINALSTAPPSQADVSSTESTAKQPRIQQSTITRLQNLQDNSVRVQSIFNDARNNPFQE